MPIFCRQKGGTVVPPCDFQKWYTGLPVNKGVSARFLSRSARPPVRAHETKINKQQNRETMEYTKLTSIRIEVDIFEKIEKLSDKHEYWKRSSVINNLLRAVLDNFDDRQVYDMLCRYRWSRNVVKTEFEITDELKPLKPRENG